VVDFGNQKLFIPQGFVYGCNFCIRKDFLSQVGGFHPDGMPRELIRYRGDGETFVSKKAIEMGHSDIWKRRERFYISKILIK
jgi:hypothetical protein